VGWIREARDKIPTLSGFFERALLALRSGKGGLQHPRTACPDAAKGSGQNLDKKRLMYTLAAIGKRKTELGVLT